MDTEDWAAWASFSWLAVAFCTSTLVSSTSALAVFKMPSLGRRRESEGTQPSTCTHGPWSVERLWTLPSVCTSWRGNSQCDLNLQLSLELVHSSERWETRGHSLTPVSG